MGADRVTQGTLSSDGLNHFDQAALVHDALNNILETSGNSHVLQALQTAIAVLPAQVALAAITAAQNLISLALNAGVLNKLKRTITVSGSLIYTTPGTTTPVLTIALVIAGVTVCTISTAALSATLSTNMPVQFMFEVSIASLGAAGTVEAHGNVTANISANTPAAAATEYMDTNTAVSAAVNLLAATNLQVQVSANSVITSIQLRQATVQVVN